MRPMLPALFMAVAAGAIAGAGSEPMDPLGFFAPTVRISAADRARLDRGEVIARVLPADDGHLAFFAASRLKAPPDSLIAWTRAIDRLKQGPLVLGVGRFSADIRDHDLDILTLDGDEIDALKRCRVGGCDFKLAPLKSPSCGRCFAPPGPPGGRPRSVSSAGF